MAKTLWIGPAGSGKTRQLLDAFSKALQTTSNPLEPDLFFVVPSAEHTERIISLLVQRGMQGFFYRRVTTLSRLANEVFQISDIPVASSLTRRMITQELLRENNWEYFSEVQGYPGFLNLMSQFVIELKEACIPSDIFRERMNILKGFEPAHANKYEALASFYEQYEIALKQRGLRDSQDALRLYQERKRKHGASSRRFKALWIDGFFDFSNLQLEYLRELSALSEEITLTLSLEDYQNQDEVFESVRATQANLERAGFEIRKMPPRSFRTQKASLLFLQKNLFTAKEKSKVPDPQEDIIFLDAIGTEGEIELIAREIHHLYATGEYRYSDFAVLFRQIKNYAPVLASVFGRYRIPVEIHERDRLKFSPWIATMVSLLSIFRNGWKREDLFAFLKSNYVRFLGADQPKEEEWIAWLEQCAWKQGVAEGREAWLEAWNISPENIPAEKFGVAKEKILKPLFELENKFRTAQTVPELLYAFKKAVYETFGILQMSDEATVFTRRDAACASRLEALLDEMKRYFLKSKVSMVSFEAFSDYFLGLIELDVYSLHERDKNRVQIYDVSLARQKEYKVVFVAGLLEKVFPMQVREDPLLSDWERKLMNGGMEFPLAEQRPRQSIERFFFYLAVTRASEKLYLSYPHLDFEGKESLPSFYLEEVKRLFGEKIKIVRQNLSRPYPTLKEAITRQEREAAVFGALREVVEKKCSLTEALETILTALLSQPLSRDRIFSALRPVEARLVDDRIRRGKYFEIREASPTRIEEYAKCPFRYFANRILKLQDASEDINIMQKGNILHEVLQRYFDPKQKIRGPLEKFLKQELETAFKKYPMTWFEKYEESLDRQELYEMLLFFLKEENERLETASFHPYCVEYSFGSGRGCDAPALKIPGEKKDILLQGRMDRIDVDPEKKMGLVIDYKRSARFKAASLELGTALQLPLYLLAMKEHLGLEPLGGEIHSVKDHKRSGFYSEKQASLFGKEFSGRSHLSEEVFQKVFGRAVIFLRKFVKEMEACEISVRPRDCESFCPFDTVCRIEKWKLPLILEEIRSSDKIRGIF